MFYTGVKRRSTRLMSPTHSRFLYPLQLGSVHRMQVLLSEFYRAEANRYPRITPARIEFPSTPDEIRPISAEPKKSLGHHRKTCEAPIRAPTGLCLKQTAETGIQKSGTDRRKRNGNPRRR